MKTTLKKDRIRPLVETALMIAMACVLSLITLWEMPLGGAVTLASMLPIMLIGIRNGSRWGVGGAFIYSLYQAFSAFLKGNVFPYCQSGGTLLFCLFFDYLIPFTLLGLAGLWRNWQVGRFRHFGLYFGMILTVFVRFCCHFLTGITIWAQWSDGVTSVMIYSLAYNGTFLLPDLGICLGAAILLLETPQMKRIMQLPVDKK